jgi:hypothetical protein
MPCYVSTDENGIESVAGETGQDFEGQIKWLGLSMRFLSTLRSVSGIKS